MNSPSSYVFYDDNNLEGIRSEGATVIRVAVRAERIDIYSKRLTKTQKSGVLFERTISRKVLSLHRNSHGQKYLKYRLSSSGSNKLVDKSLDPSFDMSLMPHGFYELLKNTLLDWFDDTINREDYSWRTLSDLISLLVSPVYRDPKVRKNDRFYEALAALEVGGHPVTTLLRKHSTWEGFIYALCPAVRTDEDFSILNSDLHNLLPVAALHTGLPLTYLVGAYGSAELLRFRRSYSTDDHAIFRFMLEHSSPEQRVQLWEMMRGLVVCFEKAKQKEVNLNSKGGFGSFLGQNSGALPDIDTDFNDSLRQSMKSYVLQKAQSNSLDLTQVPADSWPDLAHALSTHFIFSYENGVRRLSVRRITGDMHTIKTGLLDALRRWYAQHIFEPAMTTSLTVSAVEARFFELYHAAPWEDFAVATAPEEGEWIAVGGHWTVTDTGAKFYSLPTLYGLSDPHLRKRKALLTLLDTAVPYNLRLPRHESRLNAFVKDGNVVPVTNAVASAEDILALIESGTPVVDKELVRLGRAVTPENRTAYLLADPKERKFKNTWKYYDWGVTDTQKILTLKKNGVKSKADVQMYSTLPDEMFYEFLNMSSGSDDTVMLIHKPMLGYQNLLDIGRAYS